MDKHKLKISFDADGTLLLNKEVQSYVKKLVDKGFDMHIVTSRFETVKQYTDEFIQKYGIQNVQKEHEYLFEVAKSVGIIKENIHFTNMTPKFKYFIEHPSFVVHVDDDIVELELIQENCKVSTVYIQDEDWMRTLDNIIEIWLFNNA